MVGLNPARFADRDPFSLSAGEKRRLAFAAVLAMAPSFVIFDEPTAGLDGEGVGRFIALSRALRRLRVGQVIISHDGDVVRQLCDRALYITRRGDLLPLSLSELFDDPRYAGVVSSPVLSH
jgi:energy-coupling factor transporter ATP-binding protein EcfA2